MAQDSEKRFHQIMDKLFTPMKSQLPSSSTSSPIEQQSIGKKRPNPSSALALVEPKTGLPTIDRSSSALKVPAGSSPSGRCRPWDRGDLMRRLATFKSMTWFAKLKVISAVNCARRGWVNVDTDTISCESCGAHLDFSAPSSWSKQQGTVNIGDLRVGVRRLARHQNMMPTSVISSQSMHLGVLATASHAVLTNTLFVVFYKPRISQFIVGVNKYMEAMKHGFSHGIRFGMRFEGEESPERIFTGTIVGSGDLSSQWPASDGGHCRSNGMSRQQFKDQTKSHHGRLSFSHTLLQLQHLLNNNHSQNANGQDQWMDQFQLQLHVVSCTASLRVKSQPIHPLNHSKIYRLRET